MARNLRDFVRVPQFTRIPIKPIHDGAFVGDEEMLTVDARRNDELYSIDIKVHRPRPHEALDFSIPENSLMDNRAREIMDQQLAAYMRAGTITSVTASNADDSKSAEEIMDDIRRAVAALGLSPQHLNCRNRFVGHAMDLAWGAITKEHEINDKPLEKLSLVPPVIEDGQFRAELLGTTALLKNESATMFHCLWRSYTDKIIRGDYIAFHIHAPHLARSGFTVGYKNQVKAAYGSFLEFGRIMSNKEPPVVWKFDQLEGKSKSYNNDVGLGEFCKLIQGVLNGDRKQKTNNERNTGRFPKGSTFRFRGYNEKPGDGDDRNPHVQYIIGADFSS